MGQLQRTLTLIAAVIGAAAAVVILSRILLTLDDLQSPEIRVAYGVGIVVILGAVLLLYRRMRPAATRRAKKLPPPPPDRASAEERLQDIYARHDLPGAAGAERPKRRRAAIDGLLIALCGLPRTGKSSLAAALTTALPLHVRDIPLRVIETSALGTDFATNLERLTPALAADVAIFVTDQDLRDYEFAAIKALAERGTRPIVALNKTDQRDAQARSETRGAIERRLASLVPAVDIVETAADPLPAMRITTDAEGRSMEETVARAADVAQIAARVLAHVDALFR